MQTTTTRRARLMRPTALLVASSLFFPVLAGCGGNKGGDAPPPTVDDSRSTKMPPAMGGPAPAKTGMSGKQKLALLAGAALVYYMYKKHQKQANQPVQYYQSKNGRVYYRDAQHRAHWVTPPTQAELDQITPQEQEELSRYRGYNGQTTGIEDYNPAGGTTDPSGDYSG